jgi:hypothetical protein
VSYEVLLKIPSATMVAVKTCRSFRQLPLSNESGYELCTLLVLPLKCDENSGHTVAVGQSPVGPCAAWSHDRDKAVPTTASQPCYRQRTLHIEAVTWLNWWESLPVLRPREISSGSTFSAAFLAVIIRGLRTFILDTVIAKLLYQYHTFAVGKAPP